MLEHGTPRIVPGGIRHAERDINLLRGQALRAARDADGGIIRIEILEGVGISRHPIEVARDAVIGAHVDQPVATEIFAAVAEIDE